MTEARIQALYEQSDSLIERGKHAEALEVLQEAQSLDPASEQTQQRVAELERFLLDAQIDKVLDQAREHLDRGEDELAFARLTEAEELDATRVDTLELLADVTQRRNRQTADNLLNEAWELTEQGAGSEAMIKIEEARRLSPDMPGINDRILKIRRNHLDHEVQRLLDTAQRMLDNGHVMGAAGQLRQAQRLNPQHAETNKMLREVEAELAGDEVDELLSEVRELTEKKQFASAREKMLEAARIDPQRGEVVRVAKILRRAILKDKADEVKRRMAEAREKAAKAGPGDNSGQMVVDPTDGVDWASGFEGNGGFDFNHGDQQRRASNDSTIALVHGGAGQIQFDDEDFEGAADQGDDFGFFDEDDSSIDLDGEKSSSASRAAEELVELPASALVEEDRDESASADDAGEEMVELPASALVEEGDASSDDEEQEELVELPANALVEDGSDETAQADDAGEEMVQLPASALVEEDDSSSDDDEQEELVELPASALVEEGDASSEDDEFDELIDLPADALVIEDDDQPADESGTDEMANALAEISAEYAREMQSAVDVQVSGKGEQTARLSPEHLVEDDDEDTPEAVFSESDLVSDDEEDDIVDALVDSSVDDLDPSLEFDDDDEFDEEAFQTAGDASMGLSEGETGDNLDLQLGDDTDQFEQVDPSLAAPGQDEPDPNEVFSFDDSDDDFQLSEDKQHESGDDQPDDEDDDDDLPDFHLVDDDELVLGGEDEIRRPDDYGGHLEEEALSYAEDQSGDDIFAAEEADGSSVAMDAQDVDQSPSSASADIEPTGFGYYWGVTSEFSVPMGHPLPYGMEDRIDTDSLPLRRDVVVFYPSVFGEFHELGLHQLFYKKSGYDTWRTAFQGWMQRHQQKITSVLKKMFPDGQTHGVHYGVIAKGNWHIALEMTPNQKSKQPGPLANDMDFESDWDEFIRALNDEQWDETFIGEIGFTPPDGCENFRQLRRSEDPQYKTKRKQLLTGSWDHFARLYYLKTLMVCRQLCPGIRWGLMGYPATPYLAYLPNNPNIEMFRQINDRLQWLWDAEDVILPMFAATRRTVEDGESPDKQQKQNDRETDEANIRTGIEEVLRVRDKYAPDTPVISVHNLEYSKVAGGGQLEQINFENQFLLPRDCNVDGVMIAGHMISDPQLDVLADELSGRLGDAVKQAEADANAGIGDDISFDGDDDDDDDDGISTD